MSDLDRVREAMEIGRRHGAQLGQAAQRAREMQASMDETVATLHAGSMAKAEREHRTAEAASATAEGVAALLDHTRRQAEEHAREREADRQMQARALRWTKVAAWSGVAAAVASVGALVAALVV